MECAEIRDNLSGYIDGVLNAEKTDLVEKHLKHCGACRAELASLRILVSELKALNNLEAPDHFLKELHERREKESGFSRLMGKLFNPIRIKLPLELVTAATVAVIVVSIFHIQQEDERLISFPESLKEKMAEEEPAEIPGAPESELPPMTKVAPLRTQREKTGEMKGAVKKFSAKSPAVTPGSGKEFSAKVGTGRDEKAIKESKGIAAKEPAPPDKPDTRGQKGAGGAPVDAESIAGALQQQKEPVELRILVEYTSPDRISKKLSGPSGLGPGEAEHGQGVKRGPSGTAPIANQPKRKTISNESEGRRSFSRETKEKSSGAHSLLTDIENLIKTFKGKIIGVKYDETGYRPQKIDFVMSSENLGDFCQRLNKIAFMKFPCPETATHTDESRQIPLRIVFEKTE